MQSIIVAPITAQNHGKVWHCTKVKRRIEKVSRCGWTGYLHDSPPRIRLVCKMLAKADSAGIEIDAGAGRMNGAAIDAHLRLAE